MRVLLTFLVLGAFCAAPAQAERVRFIGSFHIVSKTNNAKCNEYDPVGDRMAVRYTPVIAGNPDNDRSRLGLFYSDGGRGYQLDSGSFTSTFKPARAVNLFEGFSTPEPQQQVRFATQSPAAIQNDTNVITVTGEILNYDWMVGCRIQFRMVMQRRIS